MTKNRLAALLLLTLFSAPLITSALTPQEKNTLLLQLIQKVLELNQKLIALGGTSIPLPPSLASLTQQPQQGSACTLSRTLSLGMRGDDVSCLQIFLIQQGLLPADSATGYFGRLTAAAVASFQRSHSLEPVGFVGPKTRGLINAAPPQTPPDTGTPPPAGGGGGSTTPPPVGGGGGGTPPPPPPITHASCTQSGITLSHGESRLFYSAPSVASPTACSSVSQTRTCTDGSLSGLSSYSHASCIVTGSTDTTPPSVPTGLTATVISSSRINLSWSASTDTGGSGLAGYKVYRNGIQVATTTAASHAATGLTASTTYSFSIAAFDATGNVSARGTAVSRTTLPVITTPPPDTTAPTISLTAPANGATVSGSINITATASDNVGIAGVQFKLDGRNLGAFDTKAPFLATWNTAAGTNGSHTLTAIMWGAAGTSTSSTAVQVTVANAYPTVTASPAPGTYTSAQAVALSAPGAQSIRYTLDGNTPSCATERTDGVEYGYGYTYTSPISISATRTLNATACPAEGAIVPFKYVVSVARPPVRVSVDWNTTSQDINPLAWGVNVPPFMGGRDNTGFMSALADMTLKKPLVRVYGWAKVASPAVVGDASWLNPDGTWNAPKIIALLRQYTEAGYEVMINLPDGAGTGYARYPDSNLAAHPDRVAHWFADLVRIVNVEGRLGVRYWEVLSERDNTTDAGTALTPAQMAVFLDKALRAMKAVDPTIKVGGPAAASLNTKSSYLISMVQQLQGLGTDIDFVSVHQYGGGVDPTAPALPVRYTTVQQQNAYNMLALRQGLDHISPTRRIPIFLSEYNVSWGPFVPFNTSADGIIYDALSATGAIHNGADITQFWEVSNVDDYPTLIKGGQALPASNYLTLLNRYFRGKEVVAHTSDANLVSVFAATGVSGQTQTYALMLINRSEWSETVSLAYPSVIPTQLIKYTISDAGYSGPETVIWPLQQDLTMSPHSIVVLVADSAHANRAPVISSITGPSAVTVGTPGTWMVSANDPEGDSVSYRMYWGDKLNHPSPPVTSAATSNPIFPYTYTKVGNFTISAVAYDMHDASSTTAFMVTVASSTP